MYTRSTGNLKCQLNLHSGWRPQVTVSSQCHQPVNSITFISIYQEELATKFFVLFCFNPTVTPQWVAKRVQTLTRPSATSAVEERCVTIQPICYRTGRTRGREGNAQLVEQSRNKNMIWLV